jgi:hypothetical protein
VHDASNWTSLMRDQAAFTDKINQLLEVLAFPPYSLAPIIASEASA